MTRREREKQEAIDTLREWIKEGDTVYCILRHVSKSGMTRHIGLVHIFVDADGRPCIRHPNYLVAKALSRSVPKRGDAVAIGGCGMDMGFALVDELSRALFDKGYALKHEWL